MRIDNTGASSRIRNSKPAARASQAGSSFNLSEAEDAPSAHGSAPMANVANLSALLMLQDVDDAISGKKKAAAQGFDLLDRLDEMRLGLLSGRVSSAQMMRIAHKIKNMGRSGDARLDAILSDIDMRARIELAKLGIFDL